ncbi:amidase [Allostreptomyces psammosilenae]|uniref:Amidase n=1 Tax=Allostreptomyces psammosilenae TaxID=1892865 RepID=A0A853A1S7_9ACTN|nr:amidase [Allostreptomyces psammosilenae]NYI08375.1 amidase [Allostreptomyces psammosilenae]
MAQPHDLTMAEQTEQIRRGKLSPVELTEHYLARIERLNDEVGAYLSVNPERAREQAEELARRAVQYRAARREGLHVDPLPPLLGAVVPIKDLTPVAGLPCTYGSAAMDGSRPAREDARVVELLRDAGTVMPGKTNTPEFGLPAYTENRLAPPARSPWDLRLGAGGSSGGAAAAVAAGLASAAHGTDGAGSIRIPASACGLVGFKPSRGRVTTAPGGDASGLAVHGPIARTVLDAALLLDAMSRPEPGDPFPAAPLLTGENFAQYASDGFRQAQHTGRTARRLRIGRWVETDRAGLKPDQACLDAWDEAAALLESLGHEVVDAHQPMREGDRESFSAVWSVMAAYTSVPPEREERLMPITRWLRERGKEVGGVEYVRALAAMQTVARRASRAVDQFDAVLTPTLAQLPAEVGALRDDEAPEADFEAQTDFTPYTMLWNLTGRPAVSLPLSWAPSPLDPGREVPVGVMLSARQGQDAALFQLAGQLEAARPWAHRRSPLW